MKKQYYIINKKNKSWFILGQGNWKHITIDDLFNDDLSNVIFNIVLSFLKENGDTQYCNHLAERLKTFIKNTDKQNIKIVDNTTDDILAIKIFGYVCVGSRYKSKNELNDYFNNVIPDDVVSYYKTQYCQYL